MAKEHFDAGSGGGAMLESAKPVLELAVSLIHDIQAEAIDATSSVTALLRKCKLLAARLDHAELAQWVAYELGGYPNGAALPPYRLATPMSYGNFAGAFGARAENIQIPVEVLPEHLQEHYRTARLDQPVSTYENLVRAGTPGRLHIPWPIPMAIRHASKITRDMQCIEAWQDLPTGVIDRLLDAVKNAVLGYAIEIEKLSPDAGDLPMGSKPVSEDKLTQIFNTQIAGNVGNVANGGSGVSQRATVNVGAGDWDTLRRYLQSLGLQDADLAGLQADLDTARAAGTGMDGKPSSWVGKLIGKAASGVAGVGVEVAAGGIAKAIAAYLGLS